MDLRIESPDIELSAWERTFAHTTVSFAVWHPQSPVERVTLRTDRAFDAEGRAYVRCDLRGERAGRPVAAGATGPGPCSAIQQAANLLELALFGLPPAGLPTEPGRLAA
jgi:hypothetical protein